MSKQLLAAGKRVQLGRTEKAILMAFCEHYRAPDAPRMWAIPSIAETVCVDPRTVQRHLHPGSRLIRDGYLTRRDSLRKDGQHNAPEFSVVDPSRWPATPSATRAGGDRLSPVTERHQGVVTECHPNPVLNTPLEVTDVTSLSPAGDAVAEVETKPRAEVICLDGHPKNKGLTLTWLVGMYHRHCPSLRRVRALDEPRRKALSARVREDLRRRDPQWWGKVLRAVEANEFLNGEKNRREKAAGRTDREWAADLDFILSPTGLRRIVEGKYDQWQGDFDTELDPQDDPNHTPPEVRHAAG